jgi:hypothetical protein
MEWILSNRNLWNISEIERRIGCPKGTLMKAINKERALPEHWEIKLQELFKSIKNGR